MMNAYSELDNVVVAASRAVLTDLLRGEIGFDGLVVSDYRAISMLYDFHRVAIDEAHAAHLALNAGIDVELPETKCNGAPLKQAVKSGRVPESLIDTSVERILRKKFELGLFENPFVDTDRVLSIYETPAQRQLAQQIAEQSIVLLKNESDLLPLNKNIKSIAVIGPNANEARHLFGDYSHPAHVETLLENQPALATLLKCDVNSNGIVPGSVQTQTILDAIRKKVSDDTRVFFAQGCAVNNADKSGFAEAVKVAQQADVIILVIGDKSGLSINCTSGESRDRADLGLPGVQQELVEAVAAVGKPTIAVLINGRPLSITWIVENIPAIIEAWLPGEEGGNAVADVLFGDANPGGKLTMTWPRAVGQVPIFYNHKSSGGHSHWHTNYVDLSVTPLFPFGYGLSYTQFEYSNLKIDATDSHATISIKVKNVGKRAGDEVVQLYIHDVVASVPRPVKELKGFKRVRLASGDTRTVTFELPIDILAFYDEAMQLVVEPGKIEVMVGSSSQDIRLNGSFEVSGQKRVVARRVFSCATRIE
jgi:beta-glucosidase